MVALHTVANIDHSKSLWCIVYVFVRARVFVYIFMQCVYSTQNNIISGHYRSIKRTVHMPKPCSSIEIQ